MTALELSLIPQPRTFLYPADVVVACVTFQPEGVNLSPEDPRWIGAWWLGYLAGGSILLVISGLILGFPRELPGAKRMREQALKEGHIPQKDERIQGKLQDILPATLQLIKTPVFICNTLAITSGSLFGAGIAAFIAKILQLKYGLSSFLAGVVIGVVLVPGTVGEVIILRRQCFIGLRVIK